MTQPHALYSFLYVRLYVCRVHTSTVHTYKFATIAWYQNGRSCLPRKDTHHVIWPLGDFRVDQQGLSQHHTPVLKHILRYLSQPLSARERPSLCAYGLRVIYSFFPFLRSANIDRTCLGYSISVIPFLSFQNGFDPYFEKRRISSILTLTTR